MCPILSYPMNCSLPGSSVYGFSRQEYWSGLTFLTPGDLPDPGIKALSCTGSGWWFRHQVVSDSCDSMDCRLPGSPVHGILQAKILEWVAISFSRGSSQPRDQTQVSCIAGRFFTHLATREALTDLFTYLFIFTTNATWEAL